MTDQTYYSATTNYGSYQYVPLEDIVNNFMLMYVGDEELIGHNIDKYKVIFHAKRGIQELNYDASRESKTVEFIIDSSLQIILPSDYVNLVRAYINIGGKLYPLNESKFPTRSIAFLQDADGDILFDANGQTISAESLLTQHALELTAQTQQLSPLGFWGWWINDGWYFSWNPLFGIDPADVNVLPTFSIDKRLGVMNFSSTMNGQTLELQYISDGLNDVDGQVLVNKFAEDFLYSWIKYSIAKGRSNVPEYTIKRLQKDKSALLDNAKIRMGNLHPSTIMQVLKGQSKWIKG
jgi:hypothetical protein